MKRLVLAAAFVAAAAGCRLSSTCCDCAPTVTDGPYAAYARMPGAMIPVGVLHPRGETMPAEPAAGVLGTPESQTEEDAGKPPFQEEQDAVVPNPAPAELPSAADQNKLIPPDPGKP